MKKALIALLVSVALLGAFPLFAGGTKEAGSTGTTGTQKAADTAQPQSKEAKEAAVGIKQVSFPGIANIDYSAFDIGKAGGSLVIASLSDPKSFNYITAAETSSTDILGRVYDGVVDRDPLTLEWVPSLAEKWTVAADNLSAVFTMRQGLKWSDGDDLTAEDVVFTLNNIILADVKDDKGNYKLKTNQRDGFKVGDKFMKFDLIDKLSFKVTLPSVYAGLLNAMSVAPVPKHIFEPLIKDKGLEAVNSFWGVDTDVTKVVGSGPFVIEQYVPSQKVVLKKNANYWRKDAKGNALPYLDKVTFLTVENQNTMTLKFNSKEIDILGVLGKDVATFIPQKKDGNFELYNGGPAAGSTFFVLNQNYNGLKDPLKLAWFNDVRFRKALSHLVDKETIINNVLYGFGFPQDSFIPTFSPYYWKGAAAAAPAYNPEAAKKLLDEMELKDRNGDGIREDAKGNRVSFNMITNAGNVNREAVGNMLTQEAKKVGIDITFKPGDFNAMVNQLQNTLDFDCIIIGLTGSVDPISGANVYPSSGNLHMNEPKQLSPRRDWEKETDKWWDYANLTLDENKRKEGFQRVQQIWLEQLPWTFTVNEASIYAYRNAIGNVKPRPVLRGVLGIMPWVYVK